MENVVLKNKIVFESFSDFSDNTRTLFDFLINHNYNEKYEMIWLVEEPRNFDKLNIKNVTFSYIQPKNDEQYNEMINLIKDAKYLIGTNRNIEKCNSKQIYINLWHGTPLKKLSDYHIENDLWDYLLCPSEFFADIYQREVNISKEKLIYFNNPRIDDLFVKQQTLKRLYPNQNYDKFIVWMPTYRQHRTGSNIDSKKEFSLGIPIIENIQQLQKIDEILIQNNCLLILKLHPAQDLSIIKLESMENIKIMKNDELDKNEIKLYSLIGEADALITDYSSIYFDYMVLDRPIGFTVDDINEYKGFVFNEPLDYMPGAHIKTCEELQQFIFDIINEKDEHKEKRNELNHLFNKYTDNQNSKRIVEFLNL